MERRWSNRKALEREVLLRYEGISLLRCRTHNISFEGAYIHTANIIVPAEMELEVNFVPDDIEAEEVSLGGRVVRIQGDGVGVSFLDYHEGAYQYLLRLLNLE